MLVVYCVQSLGFLTWLVMNPEPGTLFVRLMQLSDVIWPIVLCLFADPPNSLVLVFFLFALMTTAFRFGMYETVLTAVVTVILLITGIHRRFWATSTEPHPLYRLNWARLVLAVRLSTDDWLPAGLSGGTRKRATRRNSPHESPALSGARWEPSQRGSRPRFPLGWRGCSTGKRSMKWCRRAGRTILPLGYQAGSGAGPRDSRA